jgi:hypothetical protein
VKNILPFGPLPNKSPEHEIPEKTRKGRLYTFHVKLPIFQDENEEPVYFAERTIEIPGHLTMDQLHWSIFQSYERRDSSISYQFLFFRESDFFPSDVCSLECYEEEEDENDTLEMFHNSRYTTVDEMQITEGEMFEYIFNIEVPWQHDIELIKVEDLEQLPSSPRLVASVGEFDENDFERVEISQDDDDDKEDRDGLDAIFDFFKGDGLIGDSIGEINELVEEAIKILTSNMRNDVRTRERKKVESQIIDIDITHQEALSKLPANWTKVISKALGLQPASRKADRVQQIRRQLSEPANLASVIDNLPGDCIKMLRFIVCEEGGWAPQAALTRRFGRDRDNSFFWNEGDLPQTTLGILRMLGLVFVGRRRQGKRYYKTIIVPADLVKDMRRHLC